VALPATAHDEEDNMQGKRTRARDSRGRPVPGLYIRDGRFIAGARIDGRWTMHTLEADTLTDARRERESWLAGLREGRIASPATATFAETFADWQDARTISDRTRAHERQVEKRIAKLMHRRVQEISASEVAALLREQRQRYAPWSCVQTYRLLAGTFAHAVRRSLVTRNPMDGLAPSERPKQRNKRRVARLDGAMVAKLVEAAGSARWRVALGLAGYAGLRLGELRAIQWTDIDLKTGTITVRASLLPNGTRKPTKTEAGERVVPILPALRRLIVAWKLKSPHTRPNNLVICTADGEHVQERNVRRALDAAKEAAKLDGLEERLSMHTLRHSFASMLATDLELPATTLAELIGHADAGFTLKVYARDARDKATVVADVLTRAEGAGVGC
jgi:integrase